MSGLAYINFLSDRKPFFILCKLLYRYSFRYNHKKDFSYNFNKIEIPLFLSYENKV